MRKRIPALFVLFFLLITASSSFAQLPTPAEPDKVTKALQQKLEKMAAAHHGKVALYAVDLLTTQAIALNADEPVQTASTIKLALFLETFHQIKDGKIKLEDRIAFKPEDKVQGSGLLQFMHAPAEWSFEDVLTMMIIESDNTATNLVIDHVGLKPTNERLARMGLTHTYFYKKVFKPADGEQPPDQKKFGLGKTTPREMAALMSAIVQCDVGDLALCKKMKDILKSQQDRNKIPHYIESDTDTTVAPSAIAAKSGALDAVRADVAAIFIENQTILISAYTYDNQDKRWIPENEGEQWIAHMAKDIYDAWAPKKPNVTTTGK